MKTMFSADPFQGAARRPELGQGAGCVLIGTETHPSDAETLFQRTVDKYEQSGWTVVRQQTGRIFYAGTADETYEANIWACPPGQAPELSGRAPFLGEIRLAGAAPARPAMVPAALEGRQVPVSMGQVPGHPGIHWGIYNGQRVRWPDCDPRYDPSCPYPTQIITDGPALGQTGVVGGFGGPGGGGFGFSSGPGGMVGPVAGQPSPGSGPITGPSIPCGPAGGPSCPPSPGGVTIVQKVYPLSNLMGDTGRGGEAAHGHDVWYDPMSPCPPGYFRSSPGSPCVKEGDLEDYGEPYFQNRPW